MRATLLTTIILAITGDPGTHVQGRCIVDPTARTVEIDTTVPYVRSFDGAGLRCAFEAAGRAVVEAEKNGSRSRSTTNGGRSRSTTNGGRITSMSASVTLSRREREASERERVRGERPAMHSPLTPPLSRGRGRRQGAHRTPLSRREREATPGSGGSG